MKKSLKVLVIAPHYHTFVKGLVEAIANYVSNITTIVHHNYLSEVAHYLPFSYFRLAKKVTKKNLIDLVNKPNNINVHLISTVYFIPDSKNRGLGDKLATLFVKYINKNNIKFDLIHAHFTWPCGYVGVKLAEKFDVPVIVTAHGFDVYDLPFRSSFWLEKIKKVLFLSHHIITVSKRNFKVLVEKLDLPSNKISIIPNGFDPRLFKILPKEAVRLKLGLSLNRRIILNVGNLFPVKGQKYLIQAMKMIYEQKKDVKLYIVGDGPLKNKLEKYIKKLGLKDRVKLVGARPHEEIPLWMNAADLFVLSSLSEGNPTVMFEALGVGLPFVSTKVGGISEIITSKDYGLLCEPANSEDLAEKILTALEKEWDREKIRKYADQFTWERVAGKVIKVYRKVLVKK